MKTTVYLVRHAEVENPQKIEYMRLPRFGLSERGCEQAKKLATYFNDKKIAAVFSSHLLRARKTAEAIAGKKIPLKFSDLILEANFKKWEGRSDIHNTKEYADYWINPLSVHLGEEIPDIQKRMLKFYRRLLRSYAGKNVVVVSHAAPIKALWAYFRNVDLTKMHGNLLQNATILKVEINGGNVKGVKAIKVAEASRDKI